MITIRTLSFTNGLSTNGLPESTTCSTSNYTHCSQLLLIHRMVAYSNHSPVENKMATRAMLIRDAFMLPMELLTVIPYKEQGKEDWLITSLIKIIMSSCGLSMCPLYWWVTKQCEINENVRSTTTYISIIWTHHTPQYRPYQLHRAPHSASCMHAGYVSYQSHPGTRHCRHRQAQWRSYQHSSWEGMCQWLQWGCLLL